jgi:photosystem II stability/assembly factor-like uncharacterized protein
LKKRVKLFCNLLRKSYIFQTKHYFNINQKETSKMSKSFRLICLFISIISTVSFINAQPIAKPTPNLLKGLQFRQIGPFRGGRSGSVAGVPSQPSTFYYGSTGGGVWKSTNFGEDWANVSDGFFKTGSVGAIDVSLSDPNIIYVGMGEETVRGNVSHGDGVYKSLDGGKTWKNIGLSDTRQISRVRVHPTNPNIVYVAALGHLWANNTERGVYRTKDGGKTWEKVLYRDDKAGAADITFEPNNPNVLYASLWQIRRTPYSLESGGESSGFYKSMDGGDTWTEITRNTGLPKGIVGKINMTVSPINPSRIWAMVEAKEAGLYRSDDAGENWSLMSNNPNIKQRPWYFNRVYADSKDVNTVYVLNVQAWKSTDGGRSWSQFGTPHGDNHDLWISPNDNRIIIGADDGGSHVTKDGGETWSKQDQPTAQFYRVALDNDFPYNIYGAQQDNSTVRIPSRTNEFAITESDWYDVGGGESGWIAPHPDDSSIVFAGSYGGLLTRADQRTKQGRDINVYPNNPLGAGADSTKYRFQWNFPILFSPHKTDGKYPLYAAGNILFRSMDEGASWQAISPDLTTNDKSKQGSSGGPITKDNTAVEYYCTIFALSESPLKQGVIWAGSDDGLVHVTQDNGKTWSNITPKDIPKNIQINAIDASPFDAGTAYLAATAYKSDNYQPYLYKTNDYGKTWKKIVNGIPNDAFTRVVREDPNRKGFLVAGTETGLYQSFNDGETWTSFQLNLPIVPVTDVAFQKRDKDLVVATQGRSFYVMDNLEVIYALADAQKADAYMFKIEDAYRQAGGGGFPLPPTATVGKNPPNGMTVNYYFKEKPTKDVTLEVLDANGKSVRSFKGKPQVEGQPQVPSTEPQMPMEPGFNQFVWNLRLANATTIPGMILWAGSTAGPKVAPANYTVKMSYDGKVIATETFNLKADPRLATTQADFQKQFDLGLKIRDKLSETHDALNEIKDLRTQLEAISARLKAPEQKDLIDKAKDIVTKMTAVEEELNQTKIKSSQDALNFPIKLNNKLAALGSSIGGGDYAPTQQAYDVYGELSGKIDVQLDILNKIKAEDVAAFNKLYAERSLPVITTKKK